MKISTISHAISRKFMPILTTVAMAVPMKTANSTMRVTAQTQDKFVSIINSITPSDLKGLKVIKEVNFKGGVINKFDSASVEKLKQKLIRLRLRTQKIYTSKNLECFLQIGHVVKTFVLT